MPSPAILAAILFGTVTVASAQPKREAMEPKRPETAGRVILDDKQDARSKRVVVRGPRDWIEIADPTPAKFGTVFVMVAPSAGTFGKLRLDAVKGKVIVRRVNVHLSDGKVMKFRVNTTIDRGRHRSTFVELGALRRIDRVVVTTESYTTGEYAIYGSSAGGKVSPPARRCC